MFKERIEIIADKSSENLYKKVDAFCKEKDGKILKIKYESILDGKEFYAYIHYNEE